MLRKYQHLSPEFKRQTLENIARKRLAFVRNSPGGESALMVANTLDEGGEQKFATRQRPDLIRVHMWAPDGKKTACAVGRLEAGGGGENIVEVRVADGAGKLINPTKWRWVHQGAWLPDGSGLIMPFSDPEQGSGMSTNSGTSLTRAVKCAGLPTT